MKGISTLAGSASRRENEFRAGGGCRGRGPVVRRRRRWWNEAGRISNRWNQLDTRWATTDTLAASRLCGLSASCSGAFSSSGEAIECCRTREGICRPCRGLVLMRGRNPALTRWAISCRPSGPGATDWEGPGAAKVYRDRTRFFLVSLRSRSRLRSRYRERSHRHPLYPTRRGLTRNPTG